MADTTWEIIQKRQGQLKELYDRMDKTKDLVYLDPFELKNFKGQKIDHVVNVTGNSPTVFASALISDLMGGRWQVSVEGEITERQASVIEQFADDCWEQADEGLLSKFGLSSLHDWLCNHVCVRSLIGARWLVDIVDDMIKVDCVPCDMRWTPFMFGVDGYAWVAPISFLSREELEIEFSELYPEELRKISGGSDKIYEVRDYWNSEVNEIWVNKTLLVSQHHNKKQPPFVLTFPPAGYMLRDKGYLKHEAEDIFFQNRDLYPELNRALSIEQTIGMDILFPPYEQEVDDLTAEPAQKPPKSGETLAVKKGQRHTPLQRGDLNNASVAARQDIQRMVQQGGVNDIDLGNISSQVSAVWITEQSEIRNKLIRPRIKALQMFRRQSIRMIINQFITASEDAEGNGTFLAGKRGKRNKYNVSQMKDPDTYTIDCKLMTRTKKQEVANWAIANTAKGVAPLRVIIRDIIQADDPDAWLRELDIENARNADPAIALFEMAVSYAEEAEDTEDEAEADILKVKSMMLTERGVAIIRERKQPVSQLPEKAAVPQVENTAGNNNSLLPLMGNTGAEGGAPVTD